MLINLTIQIFLFKNFLQNELLTLNKIFLTHFRRNDLAPSPLNTSKDDAFDVFMEYRKLVIV